MVVVDAVFTVCVGVLSGCIFLVLYIRRKQNVLSSLGFPGPKPMFILGNMKSIKEKGVAEHDLQLIKQYGNRVGLYMGFKPALLTTDPDLITEVFVNQFDSFPNRSDTIDMGCTLRSAIALAPHQIWKPLREHLVPAFSEEYLQNLMPAVQECVEELVCKIKRTMATNASFDMDDLCHHYSIDCLMSTLFGNGVYNCKSPDHHLVQNCHMVWKAGNEGVRKHAALCLMIPGMKGLYRCLRYNVVPYDLRTYFKSLVQKAINRKQTSPSKSFDFLQWMMDTSTSCQQNNNKTSNVQGLSEEEIVANCVFFVMAGYDTVANLLGFLLLNIAIHRKVQRKLCDEIDSIEERNPSYQSISNCKFLDNVVKETLRMYPPFLRCNRICTRDVNVRGINIPSGIDVQIPIYALHRTSSLWDNPDEFIPERFDGRIKELSFLPFGLGPRDCFPKTFVMLEVKLALVSILKEFEISSEIKTPIKLAKGGFSKSENGYCMAFHYRRHLTNGLQ